MNKIPLSGKNDKKARRMDTMEISMSADEVLQEIKQLSESGTNLSKKKIKKANPELMRSALHYFPDWDSAIERSKSI